MRIIPDNERAAWCAVLVMWCVAAGMIGVLVWPR